MSEDKIDTRYLYQTLLSAKIFCENIRRYRPTYPASLLTSEVDELEATLEEALLLLNDQPSPDSWYWVKEEER